MTARAFALFGTAIGTCAIAWGTRGVVWIQLPQDDEGAARRRAFRKFPEAAETLAPPGVDLAIRDIARLMAGEPADLSRIALDMSGVPDFNRQVYAIAREIPPGETLTYGAIAKRLGDVTLARAVGVALGQNPFPIVVPCHRVLAANGKTGGFSARGGVATKMRMLSIERARTGAAPTLFDAIGGLPLAAGR
ncbi:MAG TPA: methylated-DNA--[protein]-cysteine S-methyltransferase [Bauldia sp.]|nr:methylated-DNA--[protein]-cysteine S-methyltransferase [Bauldia sp.]